MSAEWKNYGINANFHGIQKLIISSVTVLMTWETMGGVVDKVEEGINKQTNQGLVINNYCQRALMSPSARDGSTPMVVGGDTCVF